MTKITSAPFGVTRQGEKVTLYTLTNNTGACVRICDYGGTVVSILVPDREGQLGDVVLGYDDVAGYESRKYFFGATVGRCANRIAKGSFTLDGQSYQLDCNDGENHLHGGLKGFDSVVWQAEIVKGEQEESLLLSHKSPDGDQFYPGTLEVTVHFQFSQNNQLSIHYQASCDRPTLCNLTNHSYFNLSGHNAGVMLGQYLKLYADFFTEVDNHAIPTGTLLPVDHTPMDFRSFHRIGERINDSFQQLENCSGYDHHWVIQGACGTLRPCAEAYDPISGRYLTCSTTMPGVQLYCGNFIDGTQRGKNQTLYGRRSGFCLETQYFPDAIHHPQWEQPILRPGQTYDHTTVYQFGCRDTLPQE